MDENIMWLELEHDEIMSGRYLISEYGDIYSKATNKVLKPFIDKDGYKRIELTVSPNKYKKFYVHRLVCHSFIGECDGYRNEVNHINSIRDDNHYSNLEWVTISENAVHGYKHGFRENNNVVYNEDFIRMLCKYIAKGLSNTEIYTLIEGHNDIYSNKKLYTLISRLRHKNNWVDICNEYF